ncbi:ANTAR domain-containing response regulator [Lichenicoccus sp.]|uniref:ANTAR domain-containing response regulator n=1 Tax=Lichenicoccus sp. TaxID=2781899 RepID=UPI003D0D4673
MPIQILRDLRGLHVEVVHRPDHEGLSLIEHLRRIGCFVSSAWPVPDAIAASIDVVVISIDHDSRAPLLRLLGSGERITPTLIAVIGYENPSILQLVLESEVHAVIERPVRPFGLLTQLALARSLWLQQQESRRRTLRLERKLRGMQRIQRAKSILIAKADLTEEAAYQSIRRQAMSKRTSMEDIADAIINANEHLNIQRDDP